MADAFGSVARVVLHIDGIVNLLCVDGIAMLEGSEYGIG
jgi:hypothetical protein